MRATWAEIDLAAIAHNVAVLRARAGSAQVCAVVKADGYGHGAVEVARCALAAGASSLAVALVEEGAQLRSAGIEAPILLLSEPTVEAADAVVDLGLEPAVYSPEVVEALADSAGTRNTTLAVHLKVDTGMHRVGVPLDGAVVLAKAIMARPELHLASVWTHCAVADDPTDPFTREQLRRLDEVTTALGRAGVPVESVHAANSAVTLGRSDGCYDRVRCGIAVYGLFPSPALTGTADLRPAMSLKSRVSFVKEVAAGEALSYGRAYTLAVRSVIATVPMGYADGLPRSLGSRGGEVLIAGRRRPIAGNVTMDQILVDCGDDHDVCVGDEVVLLGDQGGESIGAEEWAQRTDTIGYEIVCGISPRVTRRYVGLDDLVGDDGGTEQV